MRHDRDEAVIFERWSSLQPFPALRLADTNFSLITCYKASDSRQMFEFLKRSNSKFVYCDSLFFVLRKAAATSFKMIIDVANLTRRAARFVRKRCTVGQNVHNSGPVMVMIMIVIMSVLCLHKWLTNEL